MKKTLLVLIAIATLLFALVACANDDAQTTADTSADDSADAPTGATVNIEFWDMMWGPADTYTPAIEANVERFNQENPYGINVTVQMTPWDNFYQVFLTAIMGGAGPDVSTGAGGQPIQYAALGRSLDLDPIIEAWEAENNPILNDFFPGLLDYYNWEGTQWGIPWNLDPRALVYRTDIFEEAGITSLPTTFDEFAEVLRTIQSTHPDVIPFTFAAGDHFPFHVAVGFLVYNGIGFVDADFNSTMMSPQAMEVWEFFEMLTDEGLIGAGTAGYRGPDIELIFAAGEVAVMFNSPPNWLRGTDIYDVSGVMPALRGPSATGDLGGINYFWVNGIQGYNTTDHPDESRAFIKWWAENTLTTFVDGNAGPFPVRASHYEHPAFTDSWIRTGFYEYSASVGVPVIWPVSGIYPAFLQIEGEVYPGNVLSSIVAGQDWRSVLEQQNQLLIDAIEAHG